MGKLSNWFRGLRSKQELDLPSNFKQAEPIKFEADLSDSENEQNITSFSISEEGFAPINLEIVTPINVPVGFQFGPEQIIKIYFSLDYSTLRLTEKKLYVPQDVEFFDDDEKEHVLRCNVPIGKYYAEGAVFYNIVFGGAEPIDFMKGTVERGETEYQSMTGISYYDKQVLNQKLGYSCPNQKVEEDFTFNITLLTPYFFDENGTKIKLQPVIQGNEFTLEEAKCYGTYYGNSYLVSSQGPVALYTPYVITVENPSPTS